MLFTPAEYARGWLLTRRVLAFRLDGFALIDPSWATALRSFRTLWVVWPLSLALLWYDNAGFIARYEVSTAAYMAAQFLGWIVALPLALWLVWLVCKLEGLTAGFAHYLSVNNWYGLYLNFLLIPFYPLGQSGWLARQEQIALAIVVFVMTTAYAWLIAWRTLRCNPFLALGIVTIGMMVGTSISDYINTVFFGTARPFFDEIQ